MNRQLRDQLQYLALDRVTIQKQKDLIEQLESDLWLSDQYKKIEAEKEVLTKMNDVVGITDKDIRKLALAIYAKEGNKTVCDVVKVGEYTTITVDNENLAFEWAKGHGMALKLDIAAIKKLFKADIIANGVSSSKENRVRISSDLSEYLK